MNDFAGALIAATVDIQAAQGTVSDIQECLEHIRDARRHLSNAIEIIEEWLEDHPET